MASTPGSFGRDFRLTLITDDDRLAAVADVSGIDLMRSQMRNLDALEVGLLFSTITTVAFQRRLVRFKFSCRLQAESGLRVA